MSYYNRPLIPIIIRRLIMFYYNRPLIPIIIEKYIFLTVPFMTHVLHESIKTRTWNVVPDLNSMNLHVISRISVLQRIFYNGATYVTVVATVLVVTQHKLFTWIYTVVVVTMLPAKTSALVVRYVLVKLWFEPGAIYTWGKYQAPIRESTIVTGLQMGAVPVLVIV